jgi:hypothetical protein
MNAADSQTIRSPRFSSWSINWQKTHWRWFCSAAQFLGNKWRDQLGGHQLTMEVRSRGARRAAYVFEDQRVLEIGLLAQHHEPGTNRQERVREFLLRQFANRSHMPWRIDDDFMYADGRSGGEQWI